MTHPVTPRRVLAVLALLVVLPTAASAVNRARTAEIAGNAFPPASPTPVPAGSLADEEEVVAAARARAEEEFPEHDVSVRFVGDVEGRRLVLVLVDLESQLIAHAFEGPAGTPVDRLERATHSTVRAVDEAVLVYAAPPTSPDVARREVAISLTPTCVIDRIGPPRITPDGRVTFELQDVPVSHGAAVADRDGLLDPLLRWALDCQGEPRRRDYVNLSQRGGWSGNEHEPPEPTAEQVRTAMVGMRGALTVDQAEDQLGMAALQSGYPINELDFTILLAKLSTGPMADQTVVAVTVPDGGVLLVVDGFRRFAGVAALPQRDWHDELIAWTEPGRVGAVLPPGAVGATVVLGSGETHVMDTDGFLAHRDLTLAPYDPNADVAVREVIAHDEAGNVVDRMAPAGSPWAELRD